MLLAGLYEIRLTILFAVIDEGMRCKKELYAIGEPPFSLTPQYATAH